MKPLFVSFYTVNTGYEEESRGLIESLLAYGVEFRVEGAPNFGSWAANCQHKPVYILRMLTLHPNRPIVWVDSDARLRRYPAIFDSLDCDFAATWRDGREMLSGTLYFGQTKAAAKLLEAWKSENLWHPEGQYGDQGNLQAAVSGMGDTLKIGRLPAAYTAIFDANMCAPDEMVVEHRQASRRLSSQI